VTAKGCPGGPIRFPYVNGGLFSGNMDVPRFSKIARSYLLHIGNLDWTKINPDIFGSMIQAVAEDEERGALGMHYTSVPNILKVLEPALVSTTCARNSPRQATIRAPCLTLRKRMAKIRVFDPACGSGNFLVIAYKEMRAIEAEINKRRGEPDLRSEIPLTNFAASNCVTSQRRSRVLRLSSPSTNATFCIAGRSWLWPSFCRSAQRTGSHAATRCGLTGLASARRPPLA
jgi:hypothetical protein